MNVFWKASVSLTVATTVVVGISHQAEAASLNTNTNLTASSLTSTSNNSVSPELAQQLQTTLDQTLRNSGNVGATVGITTPQGSWFGASGVSNLAAGTPTQPNDRFEIGSITKTFVSTTMLQLAEEGKLNLEDTLNQWLPDIASNIPDGNTITIRQLLNGTSGIVDYAPALIEDIFNNPSLAFRNWQPEEIIANYAYNKPRFTGNRCFPGWCYPNTGYLLSGLIAEKATGSNIAGVIRDRILNPLGMNNTFFGSEEEIPGGYVRGYIDLNQDGDFTDTVGGIPEDISDVNLSWAWTAGALVSNTQDLTTFMRSLLGGKLLQPDSLSQMLQFVDTPEGYGYGLGIGTFDFPGVGTVVGNSGGTFAFTSYMWYLPNSGIVYTDLQNSRPPSNLIEPMTSVVLSLQPSQPVPESSGLAGLMVVVTVGMWLKRKPEPVINEQ